MVSEKVGDVYDRGYSGDYLQFSNNQIGSDPHQPPPPPPGQTDYSQQWAEYYRSILPLLFHWITCYISSFIDLWEC